MTTGPNGIDVQVNFWLERCAVFEKALREIAYTENPEHYGNARDALHGVKLLADTVLDAELNHNKCPPVSGAIAFLKRAADGNHRIVSSGDLTELQIAEARANGRFYVEPGGGLGWALLPWELTTDKDQQRAGLQTTNQSGALHVAATEAHRIIAEMQDTHVMETDSTLGEVRAKLVSALDGLSQTPINTSGR